MSFNFDSMNKGLNGAIVVIFILAISFPFINGFAKVLKDTESTENRELAACPQISIDKNPGKYQRLLQNLKLYTGQFETCYKDHFEMRNYLIQIYNFSRLSLFGISPNPIVQKGKSDWYFYANDEELNYYKNVNLFGGEGLKSTYNSFEQRKKWLNDQGIEYVIIIAPNKSSIYDEYLPDSFPHKIGSEDKLTQFINYNQKIKSDLNIIDIRDEIKKSKSSLPLYYKTDSHWNQNGGYIGYNGLMDVLQKKLPNLKRVTKDDFTIANRLGSTGDLAKLMGVNEFLKEPAENNPGYKIKDPNRDYELVSKDPNLLHPAPNNILNIETFSTVNHNKSLPSSVVFKDSFAMSMVPFLGTTFGQVDYYNLHQEFSEDIVREKKPKVVIQEVVERFFH